MIIFGFDNSFPKFANLLQPPHRIPGQFDLLHDPCVALDFANVRCPVMAAI
ncbi:hypothetical protein [Novacetimonas pomaceti]|uniref:hypothetical protein n=1 Tax=Novacetimonas pomaceti TaxID=2021998 RepID=UPI001402005B|nr:hypothetical protein [Novacetimonas pomaceti]